MYKHESDFIYFTNYVKWGIIKVLEIYGESLKLKGIKYEITLFLSGKNNFFCSCCYMYDNDIPFFM